jgi:hypothetical protein
VKIRPIKHRYRHVIYLGFLTILLLGACGAPPTPETMPTATRLPTDTPISTATAVPTETPTATTSPTATMLPTATPIPTASPTEEIATATLVPTETPIPTATPEPIVTPEPTVTPIPTATPKPTVTPAPTVTPKPTATHTPKPTATHTPQPPTDTPRPATSGNITITSIAYDGEKGRSEPDEYAVIKNIGSSAVNLAGWRLNAGAEGQDFYFPDHTMAPGEVCRVYTDENHPEYCGFSFRSGQAVWANSGDCGYLYNNVGEKVSSYCYD